MARNRAKGRKGSTNQKKLSANSGGDVGGDGGGTAMTTIAVTDGLLSPELMAELGGDSAGGAMAVAAKPNKGKKRGRGGPGGAKVSNEARELAATISKSKAKKLRQLEDKRVKDGKRAALYRKLEENRLSQEQLSLLQSSKTISQNQATLRSRVKQAVQRVVAGIAVDDAAIAELESHPAVVADIEEALSLPVGSALAAMRKSTTTAGRGGTALQAGKGDKAVGAREDGAQPTGGGNGRKAALRTGAAVGSMKTAMRVNAVVSAKKRSRSSAPAAPKPVQVVTARGASSSSSSIDSGSDSVSSESEEERTADSSRGATANALSPESHVSAETTRHTTVVEESDDTSCGKSKADVQSNAAVKGVVAASPLVSKEQLLMAGADDKRPYDKTTAGRASTATGIDSVAETSGGSWAAKIMSSLARVPTSKRTVRTGCKSDLLVTENGSCAVMDADGDDSDTNTTVGEATGDGAAEGDAVGGSAAAVAAAAVASYPPPPSWLDEKAPAYHAVETPLPSVSGDVTATGSGDGRAASLRLPRPKRWVPIERPVDIEAARMQLPVCGMEQEIMEAIHDHDAVILCGETGSGKSTQVPQFLYEAGYAAHGLIGVTQPRRVAAVGTAERVAVELGTKCGRGGAVAYQIRYDASGIGVKTRVKFMTDGVLLQEIASDLLLRKYSVILLDEAHERNLNTDVLLGMLSRSIPLRKQLSEGEQRAWQMLSEGRKKEVKPPVRPLKLVIMSATLRVTDFTENTVLFPTPPPVITATSRQHPVTIHFSKRTELYDYVGETFKKVCKVHQRLPDGGVLVFLTGKREILHMCDKLRREFPPPKAGGKGGRGSRSSRQGQTDGAVAAASEPKNDENADQGRDEGKGGKSVEEKTGNENRRAAEEAAKAKEETEHEGPQGDTTTTTVREGKRRETDRESLLYRQADDDEEDAALLADMERGEDVGNAVAGNEHGGRDSDCGSRGEGGLSSGSEGEGDDDDAEGRTSGFWGDGEGGAAGPMLPPVHVVPLYAMLTAEEQANVFRAPPEGRRLIVVATNVAETSITIPGIAYVVDCGRQKRRVVQRGSGISQFEVGWVSKASADQRAGRAGRTGPGHCYRLYSSAVYTQKLEAFAAPEVLTRPLEDVMLQMKAMGVVDVSRFPFPTPPDSAGLRSAATLLANLGATAGRGSVGGAGGQGGEQGDGTGEITAVGKALALLPVGARYAKMLLLAVQGGLLPHAAATVAMLTEGDPFVRPDSAVTKDDHAEAAEGRKEEPGAGAGLASCEADVEEVRRKRAQWMHPTSDALARLKAAGAYAHATTGGTTTGGGDFCYGNLLHPPTMERSLKLRRQLSNLVNLRFGAEPGWTGCDVAGTLRPPSECQSDALRQVLLSGFLDNVAKRAPPGTVKAGSKLQKDCAYLSCNEAITEPLYIKSNSVLFSRDPQELPEWVVYQDIVRGEREGAPANMSCVTAIEATWLSTLAEGSPLLSFSEPLVSPPPTYDETSHVVMCLVTPRYGVHAWELPPHRTQLATAAPVNKPDVVFRWFGRLLLEGGVSGCLSELKGEEMLNDPPSLLTRETPTKKVAVLVLELRQRGVCSLPALVQQWRRDPTYLKGSVELWVKVGCKQGFATAWATAIKTAVLTLTASAGGGRRGASQGTGAAGAPTREGGRSRKKRKNS